MKHSHDRYLNPILKRILFDFQILYPKQVLTDFSNIKESNKLLMNISKSKKLNLSLSKVYNSLKSKKSQVDLKELYQDTINYYEKNKNKGNIQSNIGSPIIPKWTLDLGYTEKNKKSLNHIKSLKAELYSFLFPKNNQNSFDEFSSKQIKPKNSVSCSSIIFSHIIKTDRKPLIASSKILFSDPKLSEDKVLYSNGNYAIKNMIDHLNQQKDKSILHRINKEVNAISKIKTASFCLPKNYKIQ